MLTQYTVMAVFCRADQRRRHIDQMWAPDGRLAVSSLRLTTEGVDDINAHISQVHDDPDRDKGLAFTYDQAVFGEIVRLDVARPRICSIARVDGFFRPMTRRLRYWAVRRLPSSRRVRSASSRYVSPRASFNRRSSSPKGRVVASRSS